MRTKDEILSVFHDESLDGISNQVLRGVMDSIKLEVMIDIRDIIQYHLLRIGDLYSAFKEKD